MTNLGLMQSWFNFSKIYNCNSLHYHIKREEPYIISTDRGKAFKIICIIKERNLLVN